MGTITHEERAWIEDATQHINELLHNPPQNKIVAAEMLFTAAVTFLAWTRNHTNVPAIAKGRGIVWGIIRRLVQEKNLPPVLQEIATNFLAPRTTTLPRSPSAVP